LRSQREVSTDEQSAINEELTLGQYTRGELSAKHKVKLSVIYRMASDVKQGKTKLRKREAKQQVKMANRDAIEEVVEQHLQAKRYIFNIA